MILVILLHPSLFFSFEKFVLKCLGPDIISSYLVKLIKSEHPVATKHKNNINNDTTNDTSTEADTALKLVHVLDRNNESRHHLNGLAWPYVEICENVTLPSGRKVRTKLYHPPELRKNEITTFPMIVHV